MARPRGGAVTVVVARRLEWAGETLGRGGGSESPSVLDRDKGHQDGQAARRRRLKVTLGAGS
jgi:hypothetical protein